METGVGIAASPSQVFLRSLPASIYDLLNGLPINLRSGIFRLGIRTNF
jgi:hypothetical protein